jgi:hypothetical protein
MPAHAKVIASASLPKLAKCQSGNHGLNTTGGASRRNWSVTGRFPCFPPLIKQLPPPLRRMVGDLSDERADPRRHRTRTRGIRSERTAQGFSR